MARWRAQRITYGGAKLKELRDLLEIARRAALQDLNMYENPRHGNLFKDDIRQVREDLERINTVQGPIEVVLRRNSFRHRD